MINQSKKRDYRTYLLSQKFGKNKVRMTGYLSSSRLSRKSTENQDKPAVQKTDWWTLINPVHNIVANDQLFWTI